MSASSLSVVSDISDESEYSEFEDENEKSLFTARIYGTVISETLFAIILAIGLNMNTRIREMIRLSSIEILVARVVFLIHYFLIFCCHKIRNLYPINMIITVLLPFTAGFLGGGLWSYVRRYIILYSLSTDTILMLLITLLVKYEKINFLRTGGIIAISFLLLSALAVFNGIWQIFYDFEFLNFAFSSLSFVVTLMLFGYLNNCIIGKNTTNLNWVIRMNQTNDGAYIALSQLLFISICLSVLHCNIIMNFLLGP